MEKKENLNAFSRNFIERFLRKIKIPLLRKLILGYLFRRHGLRLQDFFSVENDRFHFYKVNDIYLPDESIYWPVSFNSKLDKCKNESLYAYQPGKGDLIIDLGAGLGEESILFSKIVGLYGKVIAIEANPVVFNTLKKTIQWNDLKNVEMFNVAVYRDEGKVSLCSAAASYEETFVMKNNENAKNTIKAIRFDQFIEQQKITEIHLLKVNIEGGERYLIENLSTQQIKMVHHAAIACHDFRYRKEGNEFFRTKEMVIHYFEKNGFEVLTRQTGIDYLDDWVYAKNKAYSQHSGK
jgi:FkbM family methyltransferase